MRTSNKIILIPFAIMIITSVFLVSMLIGTRPTTPLEVPPYQVQETTTTVLNAQQATSSIKLVSVQQKQTTTTATVKPAAKDEALSTNQQVKELIRLVNAKRTKAGLKPLKENGKLGKGAQFKAEDMDAKQYWAHYSPTGEGVGAWMRKFGYSYRTGGENLAMGFTTDEATVAAWMKSPTHRSNILDPGYTETGIGIKKGSFEGKETTFITQFFGEPL